MNAHSVILDTISKTRTLARNIAQRMAYGDIILLQGPLGSGKSVICGEIIRFFSPKTKHTPSPTFTIANTYKISNQTLLWHMDLYRIKTYNDLCAIGFEEAINNDVTFCIEWPELIINNLPDNKKILLITLHIKRGVRSATLASIGETIAQTRYSVYNDPGV